MIRKSVNQLTLFAQAKIGPLKFILLVAGRNETLTDRLSVVAKRKLMKAFEPRLSGEANPE